MTLPVKLIDPYVNPNLPPSERGGENYLNPVNAELFRSELVERGTTLDQLIDEMDEAGIEKAVLNARTDQPQRAAFVWQALEAFPDRFVASLSVDPSDGIMKTVREIQEARINRDIRMVRMMGMRTAKPYMDSVYFPVYAKCAELEVPVGLNVGVPGPRLPARNQHPLDIDDVCYLFPELTVVMQHGGEPWDELCVKLLLKWPRLHYMTSAFAPRYIPKSVMEYMNRRRGGAEKVVWASDYPLLGFERCVAELEELPIKDEATLSKFVRHNAERLFFRQDRSIETETSA